MATESTEEHGKIRSVTSMADLLGSRRNIWSVSVSGNWRVTFRFIGRDAEIVNYEDYH